LGGCDGCRDGACLGELRSLVVLRLAATQRFVLGYVIALLRWIGGDDIEFQNWRLRCPDVPFESRTRARKR
jgi:hypothetical protein